MQMLFPPSAETTTLDDLLEEYAFPPIAGARWWMRASMVTSIDGAATGSDGRSGSIASASDRAIFAHLRSLADAIVVGAGTVRAENYGQPAHARLVVVSSSLRLDPTSRVFDGPNRVTVVASRAADWQAVERLAEVADVVRVGDEAVDLRELVGLLADQGLRRLQCEGGPSLLGDMLAAGLVDELCLTTVPTLVAGDGPRVLVGPRADPPVRMTLASLAQDDDGTLFARWSR